MKKHKTINTVLDTLGFLSSVLGLLLLLPIIVALIYGEYDVIRSFLIAAATALIVGGLLRKFFKFGNKISSAQSLIICGTAWIVLSIFAALPFYLATELSYLNSYFEVVSGFTTTGITILTDIEVLPKSLIFWRGLTQWLGGLGILTLFLAVTFRISNAYSPLFAAESHKIEAARPTPSITKTAKILWGIYTLLTVLQIIVLKLLGVSLFDAVSHSFTALSTGGFSPYNASIDHFRQAGYDNYIAIEYVMTLFMLLGGINFLMHFKLITGDLKSLISNAELKFFLIIIVISTSLIMLDHFKKHDFDKALAEIDTTQESGYVQRNAAALNETIKGISPKRFESSFRASLFTVVSIVTTTGYGTVDINRPFFPFMAKQILLFLMLIGGCVGSTGGGIKVMRALVLWELFKNQLRRLLLPEKAICEVVIEGRIFPNREIKRISGLFFGWVFLLAAGGMITAFFTDLDSWAALSGMFSALGNIGPCYFSVAEMASLPGIVKVTYIFGMLAGRLEILPILLILNPKSWID